MSMIFDSFPTIERAEQFAGEVRRLRKLKTQVCVDRAGMETGELADVFPFELSGPIVLVERSTTPREIAVERMVGAFGGSYAGT